MSECTHRMRVGTTMYVGKRWECVECGEEMECIGLCEHREVSDE